MGFGNSPLYWYRFTNTILALATNSIGYLGCSELNIITFFDDIAIHTSGSVENQRTLVKRVLEQLERYGLRANPANTRFEVNDFVFLGHRITDGKILPSPKSLKTVEDIKPPTTVKQFERLIGTFNWLRESVPYYSIKTSTLMDLKNEAVRNGRNTRIR